MSFCIISFREGDTGLVKANVSLDTCRDLLTGSPIVSTLWTLTEMGRGVYVIDVPETEVQIFISVTNSLAAPTVVKCESISEADAATLAEISALLTEKAATAAAIRIEMDANSTRLASIVADTDELQQKFATMAPANVFTAESLANMPTATVIGGIGTGNVLFKWYEYDQGYADDPAHAVSGVICAVYNNEDAAGDVEASAVTDETGCAVMWLNAGTYYLFRRKAGRAFTNPTRVTVSHTAGDSVEEDELALNYVTFTWYEYEDGHDGEPAYAIADVDVLVYDNDQQSGDPAKTGRTNADGLFEFRVPAGTYYLFRSAIGRVFTNPVEITVS